MRSPRVVFCTKIVLLERRLNFEDLRETNSLADVLEGTFFLPRPAKGSSAGSSQSKFARNVLKMRKVLLNEDLLSVLPHTRIRQSYDINAHLSRVFFLKKALNVVLHLNQLSDQLDVTFASSKIVKRDLTWVVTTQSDSIK